MQSALSSTSPADGLRVAGFIPCSTQDWPDQLAAVVFVAGCPWRCHYCHNPQLQSRSEAPRLDWASVRMQLEARGGLLDGVVFSGGEPTVDARLPAALEEVRAAGFLCGLHTAGCYPQRLSDVLPLLDWVGLDIKAMPAAYAGITGLARSGTDAWASLDLVQAAGVDYEVRVTADPAWLPSQALAALLAALAAHGVPKLALQAARAPGQFRSQAHYSPGWLQAQGAAFEHFVLRGFA